MKLATLLVTPWRVTHRSQCWLMLAIFALCVAAAVALGHVIDNPRWWLFSTMLYCAGIVFFWMFQMPHLLLVSIDARRLHAPAIPQTAAWSTILYAVLCVAAPVLVLAPLGANTIAVALAAALTIAGGPAFALLPRYALFLGWLVFFVGQGAARLLHISMPNHPAHATVAAWGICVLLVLLAVDILRWRALARKTSGSQTGIHSAMVMQFARGGALGLTGQASQTDGAVIRRIPEWLRGRVELRGADPAHPARAIRIALGRRIMPLTWRSHLQQGALAAAWLAIILIVLLGTGSSDGANHLLRSSWFWMLMGAVMVISLPTNRLMAVRQRWSGAGVDLSLLALLPGLGSPAEQKRHTLHAILLQPLAWLLGALLACWIVVAGIHATPVIAWYALLAVLGIGALLGAAVLGSVGGKPIGGFALGVLFVALLILVGLTPFLDQLPGVFLVESRAAIADTREIYIGGWLVWLVVVGHWTLRGWRGLQRRAHPFLANP